MRVRYERYQGARISAKSHKELPTLVGGSLVGGASGMKEVRQPGSAQNLIRRESHKEGPIADGRMPYELASGNKSLTVPESAKNLIRRDPSQMGGCLMSCPLAGGCLMI